MTTDSVKVLIIIGRGRSGTTILDNILGEIDGFFSTGELHELWKRLLMGHTCGCGRRVSDCEMWSSAVSTSLERTGREPDIARALQRQKETVRLRHLRRLQEPNRVDHGDWEGIEEYKNIISRVYQSVADLSGARVIVDSSKLPALAALMQGLPEITPYVLHVVRDPRAVAYSYQRFKLTRHRAMPCETSLESSLRYMYRNLAASAVLRKYPRERYMRLRYEDFVSRPLETLREIAALVGEEPATLPVGIDGAALLHTNHTVAGNPSRFTTGPIRLRLDDEWVSEQRPLDRLTTSFMTLPLIARYGYPLLPKPSKQPSAR